MDTQDAPAAAQAASAVNIVAGVWLFVSPWVFGAHEEPNAWNSWIVGAVIALAAAFQYGSRMGLRSLSWINCFLGIWVFCSPWIYGYLNNTGRLVSSLCMGVIVFLVALRAATSAPRPVEEANRRA